MKKLKCFEMDERLAIWFEVHAKKAFVVPSNFTQVANKILTDYAIEHGFSEEEENKEGD